MSKKPVGDKIESVNEWMLVNRHLQRVGTATCDVSNLILMADSLRSEDKNSRAAEILMSAARDVLRHRKEARRQVSLILSAKRIPKR